MLSACGQGLSPVLMVLLPSHAALLHQYVHESHCISDCEVGLAE